MKRKTKAKTAVGIGIVEAVETLSSIVDLDLNTDLGLVQEKELSIQGEKAPYRTVHWVGNTEPGETLAIVQETFKVVLRYLKSFYKKEYQTLNKPETIEEIKTIMVLVGEAANKLDKYHTLFTNAQVDSASTLPEYKKLQKFYRKEISKKVDSTFINRWLQQLPQKADDRVSNITLRGRKKVDSKHAFVDLDAVKRDETYELFFIRKENGTRYFNPKLVRNIKLVHDFDRFFSGHQPSDPIHNADQWMDKVMLLASQQLLSGSEQSLEHFLSKVKKRKNIGKIGQLIQKTIIALMLAANPKNLSSNKPIKSCSGYFRDFQLFLRKILISRSFQKMNAYPPAKSDRYHLAQIELIESLCLVLYRNLNGLHELSPVIQEVIELGVPKRKKPKKNDGIAERIKEDYEGVAKAIKGHREGPLSKVLKMMNINGGHYFDSIMQENLPSHQYILLSSDGPLSCLRVPSPTQQEFIHRAKVNPEFLSFLRSYSQTHRDQKHLLINLQDRTSWREHLRSTTLEELGRHKSFRDQLAVATIAKSTDFYQQKDPYNKGSRSSHFREQFLDQLSDDQGGYYFPASVKRRITGEWSENLFDKIHHNFFESKNVLSRKERMVFIDIFHWFLELKLIEALKVDSFSLSCKDSVDTGQAETVGMFCFCRLINGEPITEKDRDYIETLLFAPALMIRQRNVLPERVERMVAAIAHLQGHLIGKKSKESVQEVQEAFSPLYKSKILESIPKKD